MGNETTTSVMRMSVTGVLAWLVPGLGHLYIGQRARGIVCLVTVTATFWTGVAIGGVPQTVNPEQRRLWFAAQLCTAGNALSAYAITPLVTTETARNPRAVDAVPASGRPAHWMSADIGVHYTGVAGLLNLLVIFDALARAEPRPATRRGGRDSPGGRS